MTKKPTIPPPPRRPFPLENVVCARHDAPIHYRPADGQFYCPRCETAKALRALVAGKAVAA